MSTEQKKIGIITWTTYNNFGTHLQALALYSIIKKFGYECKIISDSDIISRQNAKIPYWKKIGSKIKNRLIPSLHSFSMHKKLWKDKNQEFKNECLEIDEAEHGINGLNNKYDVLICGSDQIWSANYPLDKEYISHFFLKGFNGVKIAYAPSINLDTTSLDYERLIIPLLEDFDLLSVREPEGANYISKITNREVRSLLDPTLLLSSEEWISVLRLENKVQNQSNSDYYFCYLLSYNPKYIECIEKRAIRDGKRLIVVSTHPKFEKRGHEIFCGSPREFVDTLINSAGVFTDSFHGSIFSLLFSKPFILFKRFKGNLTRNQNIRINNLLNLFNLPISVISDGTNHCLPFIQINPEKINQSISEKKNKSLSYILNGINNKFINE